MLERLRKPFCFDAFSVYLRARRKLLALALLFSVREQNKEAAQMERILRNFVEHCQTVTPCSDSSGVSCTLFALKRNRRMKNSTMFSAVMQLRAFEPCLVPDLPESTLR